MTTRTICVTLRTGLLGVALAALTPAAAIADECNGFINISYPNFPPAPLVIPPPQEIDMQVNLGTGSITGGPMNVLTLNTLALDLACNADFPLVPGCEPDGPPNFPPQKVEFVGMVNAICGGSTFTPAVAGNVVTFTANPPLVIPANQPTLPGFCSIRFTLRVLAGFSSDNVTPFEIEELVGYGIANCDNGVLVSGGFQTSSIPVMPPAADHFQCYETPRHSTTKPDVNVSLTDQFGTDPSVRVVRATDLCAPVNKNDESPGAENSPRHLAIYVIDGVNNGAFDEVDDVLVTNQFGEFLVDVVGKPDWLMVPTAKGLGVDPQPLAAPGNHYLCHKIDVKEQPPGLKQVTAQAIDQFGSHVVRNLVPVRLCAPVDKNGEGIPDPDSHLLCFNRNKAGSLGLDDVRLVNQFFNMQAQAVELTRFQEFCVESQKFLP